MGLAFKGLKTGLVNSVQSNAPFIDSPKTPKNHWFSGVFRGYKMGTLIRNVRRSILYSKFNYPVVDNAEKCANILSKSCIKNSA